MHPKFLLVSDPKTPLIGTFVYGMVGQHKELIPGYVKTHGGGWFHQDESRKIMTLYGRSGDYGEPDFRFLDRIPAQLHAVIGLCQQSEGWRVSSRHPIFLILTQA